MAETDRGTGKASRPCRIPLCDRRSGLDWPQPVTRSVSYTRRARLEIARRRLRWTAYAVQARYLSPCEHIARPPRAKSRFEASLTQGDLDSHEALRAPAPWALLTS